MEVATDPHQSKLRAERQAMGMASALLILIESRGLPITEDQRCQIEACRDKAQLLIWVKRSVVAPSVAHILWPKISDRTI